MQEFRVFRALGLAFKAWARNFIPITLLAAILYTPVIVWIATSTPDLTSTQDALVNNYFVRPTYILVGISTFLAPLLTYRIIQDLNGTRVSLLTSVKYGARGILPAILLAAITNVLAMIPVGGILGAILNCIWFVASPAAVAERLGPFAALSRSAVLTKGRRWGIFGLTFVVGLLMVLLMMAYIIPMVQHPDLQDPAGQFKQAAIVIVLIAALFNTLTGIVAAVSYALLRQDKDGVTHEELARVFE